MEIFATLIAVALLCVVTATYQGCYLESMRRRHFSVSPGDYSPELTTTLSCKTNCGIFNYVYAGITSGKFCYCANSLPAVSPVADANCNVPCVGDTGQTCGGAKHVSVYQATQRISGLTIVTDADNKIIPVTTPVTIELKVDNGSEISYKLDYDDGAGRTAPNASSMLSRTYNVPGEYFVKVYASNANQTAQEQVVATTVRVDAPPGESEVTCEPVFATYEFGICTYVIWWGTSLKVNLTVSSLVETFAIEDPPLSLAGPAFQTKGVNPGNSVAAVYVMHASEFSVTGKIIGWEVFVDVLGSKTLTVLIMKPVCTTGNYCYSKNTCSSSPCESSTSRATTCPVNEQFCGQASKCYPGCATAVSRYASPPTGYEIVSTATVTASSTGYQYIPEATVIKVSPGYVLGLRQDAGAAVLGRTTSAADTDDTMFPSGTTVFTLSAGTSTLVRHAIKAVASAGSKVHLPFRFESSGNFVLNAVATSRTLGPQATVSVHTSVIVLDGVNATILTSPTYSKTGSPVTFTVEPHTGSDVFYNWTISDGTTVVQSRNRSIQHTFTTKGVYDVNVTTYNGVSDKRNGTTIYVQNEITSVTLTSQPTVRGLNTTVLISVANGSNYTCTYNYGDNTLPGTSGLIADPLINATKAHTYATTGTFTLNVTCANDVSNASASLDVKVQDSVTNLRLILAGANRNQDFYIEWIVDAGTDLTFTLVFDGKPLTNFTRVSSNRWRSDLQPGRQAAIVPLTLTASNDVSYAVIETNFTILTAIVNPRFNTTATGNITSHVPITFFANVDAGSDVNITVDYGDTTFDNYLQPQDTDWPGPRTFTHTFLNGGRFQVTATFRNAGGVHTRSVVILILVGVGVIDCDLDEYALYHPPAYVNLTFLAPSLPTEPTLTLNWGEPTSRDIRPALTLNQPYPYTYRDTGTFNVTARLENLMGSKTCTKPITVVEKLAGPAFILPFTKAAVGLPFVFQFCLFRGPSGSLCNLTYHFNDSSSPVVIQRQANIPREGKDGCDLQNVTYTSLSTNTLSVTATSPLETVSLSVTVAVINGIKDADVAVTVTNSNVSFTALISFTVSYTGAVQPDGAFVRFEYGDGYVNDRQAFGASSYVYKKDGIFSTNVTVYNDASSVTKTVQVGVFKNFLNLRVQAYYLADIPFNAMTFGFNNASIVYPQNKPIYFWVTDDNKAFAATYDFTALDSGGTVVINTTYSQPLFNVQFNETDTYTIAITARNPLHTASIAPKTIQLLELVQGFSLTEAKSQVRANENKTLLLGFNKTGTDTCVYVDYGDGLLQIFSDVLAACTLSKFSNVSASDKHKLSGLTSIDHIYGSEGYYEVRATAMNAQSQESVVLGFSISGLDCSKPSVNIHNRKVYFTNPEVYKKSERVAVRGLTNIKCVNTYDNVKSWKIEKIDELYDTVTSNISLTGVDTTKAELNLPARFLDLGLYKIHYTMTMDGAFGGVRFASTTHTYIKIVKTDLIGVMVQGGVTEIQRGTLQTLTLEPAKFSIDPDEDPKLSQGLTTRNWTCRISGTNSNLGCTEAGFSPTSQTQNLNIGLMQLKTYQISVSLYKDTRETGADIFVTVVNGDPPKSSISPAVGSVYYQMSDGYKVLKSSRVALDCDCSNCAGPSISYEWTVFLYDYRWPNGWRPLGEDDLHGRVSVQASKQISIEASLFETFNATRMRAECLITQGGMTGKVATNLQINNPPIPGNCTVSPYSRTITTESVWTLQVDGWYDEDGLQEYQFFIHTDNSTVDKQITSVKTDSGRYTLNVSLSEGPDYLNYTQTIIVKVRDTLGAIYTMNCGSVVVLPMPLSDIRALARDIKQNQLHELKKMFAEGDQKTCSEKATSIMSLLNSDKYAGMKVASNFANTMFGLNDADRPAFMAVNSSAYLEMIEYKKESERDDRAAVRRSLITEMTKLETKSVIAIQQVSSFFAEATIYSDEIDQSSQKTVIEALESMTDFMLDENNIDKVPSEDIEIAIANGVAAIGGILDAAGNNGFFGTLTELDQATEDPLWSDYDTSIAALGGEDDMSSAGSFEEAMKIQTARIHKIRQEKTAEMVREKAIRTMDKQIQCFSRYSVPGQAFEVNSLKMKMLMEKTDISNMQGKEVTAPGTQAGVVLPNITFISGASGSDPVVVSLSQSTNHPLRYSKAANSISSTSNFVSINLYKGDNTKLDVANLKEPVKVTIPRDINMEKPKYLTVKPMIPSWSTLMNIVVNINNTQSSLHLDFKEIEGRQFLLVIKMGKLANIANETDFDDCDMVFLMPANMSGDVDDKERFRFQLDNTVLGSFTGTLAVGIRELNYTEFDMDVSQGCLSLPRYENGSDYFNGDFSLRQYVTQCLAISDSDSDWSTDGCVVGKETDVVNTVCYCTHLTTFAGGWVVVPNTIDWSYVFANADFLSNPTIYITVMVTALLYLIGAVWARLRDKKMSQQLGIAPLADNDPSDRYFYEVLVCTGMRRNAGTDSQVCFVLSGEDDESDVRAFTDSKRKIFRRGQVDGFLMAVPRPLGYLNFMRIWHDNSGRGKFASWYLNYIVVRDVQTDVKQVFIANKWLAVEEDDGQVDRVIPVATQEQLGDFSYQFGERSRKNLIDGHLWFSVVARPPQSRFTCLQRVSCCLCLLYVSMLANAMFYRTASTDESSSKTFSFGPFSVSPEQIFIGVISNLIVFPVNFLLIYLFRKARPHHKRPSRIDLAIKEVCEQSKQASINDIKPEVSSIFSVSKTPTFPKDPYRPGTADSRPGTAMSSTSTEQLTERKKKKKFELPWYFTIIAWVLLWVITLGSVVMVIFYGISFKDETCRKWITSLLVSFFTSVFITQPIKVFLFAVVLSIIFKNPKDEEEDEEDDEELPNIDPESELLHNEVMGAAKPKKIGYKPPDPQVLEKIRATRLKEIQMWAIIREVVIYAFFLWILMLISYRQLGAGNFLYKDTMKRVFIDSVQTDADFETLRNTDDFWVWATSGLVNGIRAGAYYNDYPPLKLRAYINDKVSRILGYATMRQLRIKPAQCEVPDQVEGLVSECNVKYEMFNQEEKSFKVGWLPMGPNDTIHDTRPEYTYTTADALDGYPYWGTLSWYSGGGYVVPLVGSKEELIGNLTQLKQERWVDRYTRAVFVEFTTYNPQVNLFAISTILAEFHPSGGVVTSYRFEPAMLLPYMTSAMLFQLVCEVVYILFTAFFIIRELRELIKTRLSYFMHFWNLVEIGIIAMSLSAIVIFFYRLYKTNDLTKAFKESNGNGYVKFQYVGYWNEMFSYMIGFLVFLATLKFLKLLRFNKKISMLSATLEHSAKALLHFGIIFLIVFMAFAQLFYLTFMHIDIEYATFISSVVSSVLMMMGKFDMYAMVMAEPILSQVFVLLYVLTVSFIIVNIFVSILNETFAVVREDISKQGNDFEIVDFMMLRFKKWTGISQSEDPAETKADPLSDLTKESLSKGDGQMTRDHVQDFPDRIERLLKSISSVYNENDNLSFLYQQKQPYSAPRDHTHDSNTVIMRSGQARSPAPPQQRRKDSVVARVQTD